MEGKNFRGGNNYNNAIRKVTVEPIVREAEIEVRTVAEPIKTGVLETAKSFGKTTTGKCTYGAAAAVGIGTAIYFGIRWIKNRRSKKKKTSPAEEKGDAKE